MPHRQLFTPPLPPCHQEQIDDGLLLDQEKAWQPMDFLPDPSAPTEEWFDEVRAVSLQIRCWSALGDGTAGEWYGNGGDAGCGGEVEVDGSRMGRGVGMR